MHQINGLHLLLTYTCTYECDHCFVYGSPNAKGVMTISDLRKILTEAKHVESVDMIYFEGGEPFLYYPTMLWGVKEAKKAGFKIGIVTNAYWANSVEDAKEWLKPIARIGVDDLSISDDVFHAGEDDNLSSYASEAATRLGLPVSKLIIEDPQRYLTDTTSVGEPVTGGAVLFKGRAAETLVEGLPKKAWDAFDACKPEDFANQKRVHIDPLGYIHVCQGITIGNRKQRPLKRLLDAFNPHEHPICHPILEGGPAELVRTYQVPHEARYVDGCHLCYKARLKLRDRFPAILTPDQMYGRFP